MLVLGCWGDDPAAQQPASQIELRLPRTDIAGVSKAGYSVIACEFCLVYGSWLASQQCVLFVSRMAWMDARA